MINCLCFEKLMYCLSVPINDKTWQFLSLFSFVMLRTLRLLHKKSQNCLKNIAFKMQIVSNFIHVSPPSFKFLKECLH